MAEYTQGIIIDGISYNIPLVELKLTFDFLEKYAERTDDGDIKIETIGGYQNYTIKIGTINDSALYKKLFDHVTDVKNRFHRVIIPDSTGNFEFYGYFSSISASVEKILGNGVEYKDFTWKMTEKKPTKKA